MTDNQSPENDVTDAAPKRPTPAASAASRARRIGGMRPPAPTRTPIHPVAASTPVHETVNPSLDATVTGQAPVNPVVVTQVPGWLRWLPAMVLGVCAIVMIGLVAITAHSVWYAKPSAASIRDQVLASAKTCVVATNTYKYADIPAYEAAGEKCTTGRYTSQYMSAMKNIVTPAAKKLGASQSVQINDAGIETISKAGQQFGVVIYGQTTITQKSATKSGATRVDPFALSATMKHVGGKWLITRVGLLTSASS